MEKVLNEENTWDNATTCEKAEKPCELIEDMRFGKLYELYRKVKQMAVQELYQKCLWLTKIAKKLLEHAVKVIERV